MASKITRMFIYFFLIFCNSLQVVDRQCIIVYYKFRKIGAAKKKQNIHFLKIYKYEGNPQSNRRFEIKIKPVEIKKLYYIHHRTTTFIYFSP